MNRRLHTGFNGQILRDDFYLGKVSFKKSQVWIQIKYQQADNPSIRLYSFLSILNITRYSKSALKKIIQTYTIKINDQSLQCIYFCESQSTRIFELHFNWVYKWVRVHNYRLCLFYFLHQQQKHKQHKHTQLSVNAQCVVFSVYGHTHVIAFCASLFGLKIAIDFAFIILQFICMGFGRPTHSGQTWFI